MLMTSQHKQASGRSPWRTDAWFAAPVLVIALVTVIGYIAWFPDGISSKQEVWGQFGDFIGGVLNPVIGLVTVLLVLRTLRETRAESARVRIHLEQQTADLAAQLRLAQDQDARNQRAAELTELHRCLDECTRLIEEELKGSLPDFFPLGYGPNLRRHSTAEDRLTKADVMSRKSFVVGALVELRDKMRADRATNQSAWQEHVSAWSEHFWLERQLVPQLATYVALYDERAPQPWLSDVYKRRVYNVACALALLGLLEAGPRLLPTLRPHDAPDWPPM
jgi:hypothetical protein